MALRTINFYDGYTSATAPDITQVDVNSVVIFADDGAFEAEYTAEEGSLYYNTTIHSLKYYDGTDWQVLANQGDLEDHTTDTTIHFTEAAIDHENILNIGSYSHGDIDGHIADTDIHFTEASIDHENILNVGTNSHTDIDTHIGETTAHGISGDVVGTSDTQDLSAKTFTDAPTFTEIATPSTPASGKQKIYPKTDGKFYRLNDTGEEIELGAGGGGGGGYNYNENDFNLNIDGVSTTNVTHLAISYETSAPILDDGSLKIVKSSSATSSDYVTLLSFTLQPAHFASMFEVELGIKEIATYTDGDASIEIFDGTNTIAVTPAEIYTNTNFTAKYRGTFQTSASATSYQVRLRCNNTNAWTLIVDGFSGSSWYVGPQRGGNSGAVVTDWESYTPTWTTDGATQPTLGNGIVQGWWRKVGSDAEVQFRLKIGSMTNVGLGAFMFSLPSGMVADTSKMTTGVFGSDTGYLVRGSVTLSDASNSTNRTIGVPRYTSGPNTIAIFRIGGGAVGIDSPFVWQVNDQITGSGFIPILGWSSNTVMSEDAGGRDVVFRVRGSAQTISTTDLTKITSWNQIQSDTTNSFDTTNGEYVIPESGFYDFNLNLRLSSANVNETFLGQIVTTQKGQIAATNMSLATDISNNSKILTTNSGPVYLEKGDKVYTQVRSTTDNSYEVANSVYSNFSGAKRSSPVQIAASEKVYVHYQTDTTQAITNAGVIVDFEDKIADTHGAVTTGASWKFTAPRAGYYKIDTMTTLTIAGAGVYDFNGSSELVRLSLRKNGVGADLLRLDTPVPSAIQHFISARGGASIYLNKGEYISIWFQQSSGNNNYTLTASATQNWITILSE
jgi:hypothetical protein